MVKQKSALRPRPKYIIRYNSKIKFYWDGMMNFLAIYTTIVVPYAIGFHAHWAHDKRFMTVGLVKDIMFMFDILINFRTSFVNLLTGQEVIDPKKLAKHYLFTFKFCADVLASIPFEWLGTPPVLNMFGVFKIVKVTKIPMYIDKMNAKQNTKTVS